MMKQGNVRNINGVTCMKSCMWTMDMQGLLGSHG